MSRRDWQIAAVLFAIISSVYFATVAGITSSNDGSHYALVRALADKRSFEISDYLEFTENQDYALRGDLRFSDRPPGTALLSAPLYAVSTFLPPPLSPIRSKHDSGNPRMIYALMIPVAAASATAIILFWTLRVHFGLAEWTSVLTTLAFAFGTMTWKYGSLLYSHATSGLIVMGAVAIMLNYFQKPVFSEKTGFWLGVLLGASALMEYTNIVFIAFAGAWCVGQIANLPYKWRQLLLFGLGGLLPGLILMGYNATNFGSPFSLSTFNADTSRWPQNASLFTDFATPIWVGLPAMLFYGYDNQGLFWLAPISLLGLWGLKPLWEKSRREFLLIVGAFVAMLLLFSTSTTFNPYTNDGRYLTPFLGLWFVVVGFGISRMQSAPTLLMVYGLLFLSIRNQIMHIAFAWGHDLNLAVLRPWAAAPENIVALWHTVLPNVVNVPLWWGMLAAGWVVWRVREQRIKRERI